MKFIVHYRATDYLISLCHNNIIRNKVNFERIFLRELLILLLLCLLGTEAEL